MECGRPRCGVVADIMRKTRSGYHYAIRMARRNAGDNINEHFAEVLVGNRGREWSEAKKIRRSMARVSCVVDGVSDVGDIADLSLKTCTCF